jgi:hypothetical protein
MEAECARHLTAKQEVEAAATAALEKAEEVMHANEDERTQMMNSQTLLSTQLEAQAAQLKAAQEEQVERLDKIQQLERWQAEDAIKDRRSRRRRHGSSETSRSAWQNSKTSSGGRRRMQSAKDQATHEKELELERQLAEMRRWKHAHMAEDVQEVQQLREMELQLQATKAHQAQEEARKASEIESLKEALATAEAEERAKEEAFQAQLEAAEREKQEQAARLEVMQEEKKVVGELSKKMLGYELSASGEIDGVDNNKSKCKKKQRAVKKKKQTQKDI